MLDGINRNIVECKFISDFGQLVFNSVLIETLWNVNTSTPSTVRKTAKVLIETLWNVNLISNSLNIHSRSVLIETLWNVNTV